jgi:DNA polymerase III subunit epsilon
VEDAYWLFIDTETTGLPRKWWRPYSARRPWPYVAQVAWQLYTPDGRLVKEAKHYLRIPAGTMSAGAVAIHGLTPAFLAEEGEEPTAVLERLHSDLHVFRPRVIGYFLQLDFHVLGVAFHRAGLPNLLPELPQFCLMRTTHRSLAPDDSQGRRYRRLAELHEELFGEPLRYAHDAYVDTAATARCFFELRRRGELPTEVLNSQPALKAPTPLLRWPTALLAVTLLVVLLFALLWIVA